MNTGEAEVVDYIDTLLDQAPAGAQTTPAMGAAHAPPPAAAADGPADAHAVAAHVDPVEAQAADAASTAASVADGAPAAVASPDIEAPALETPIAPAAPAAPDAPLEPVGPPAPAASVAPAPVFAPAPASVAAAPPRAPRPAQAEPPSTPMQMSQAPRWLRVVVGGASYALELLRVQEVVRLVPIVQMRGAQPAVLGVMNLRGRIVPVFDLGLWLGTGRVDAGDQSRIVVVERNDELIGLLVDAVEDVVTLGRDRIEPPLAGDGGGVVLGVARVGSVPTVLFDAYALYG